MPLGGPGKGNLSLCPASSAGLKTVPGSRHGTDTPPGRVSLGSVPATQGFPLPRRLPHAGRQCP